MSESTAIRNLLRARLIEKGTSVERWGREHGYIHGVVHRVLCRYIGNAKRPRKNTASDIIISQLEAETGIKICG